MESSTITDKGQTTVPRRIRQALNVNPGQRLEWTARADGTAVVQPQPSALDLFGSLKSRKKFPGRAAERIAAMHAAAKHAARAGIQ
jgi:bifunctional DNA-binding transcriptional regulator/antitoxin component of YhaV-PrlF toxin-antitoxin module